MKRAQIININNGLQHLDIQGLQQMEAECEKQLLRNIESTSLKDYLTPSNERVKFGYHKPCIQEVTDSLKYRNIQEDCVGLSCESVQTDTGLQISRVCLINIYGDVLMDEWFKVREGSFITDYNTHITGTTSQTYQQKIKEKGQYTQYNKQKIIKIINSKVVVGHDLASCINLLGIQHQAFIDTVSLMPHHFGFPYKNKLKDLAYQYLKKYVQWGAADTLADTVAVLQIVKKHIDGGRGTIQVEPCPFIEYKNNYQQIIKAAQLDINRVLYFVLRGSRSIGLEVEQPNYCSDWDYILVYDTSSCLDGRLIKLPNIDISFFDKASFLKHLQINDISYIQSFFMDKKNVFVNKFELPQIQLGKLRDSLGFHLNKCKLKSRRFMREVQQHPSYQWKILKSYHLGTRFTDLFMQLFEFHKQYSALKLKYAIAAQETMRSSQQQKCLQSINKIKLQNEKEELLSKINIKRMNHLWYQIQAQFVQNKNFNQVCRKLQHILSQKQKQCNGIHQKVRMLRHKDQQNVKITHRKQRRDKSSDYKLKPVDSSGHVNLSPKVQLLQTVIFLRQHPFPELQQKRIICKRHRIFPNLIQFHYQQSANFADIIARQCRGLILDQDSNYQIIALPYYKFFDYNDPRFSEVSKVDWDSVKVYEKKDGSFAFLYFYRKQWHVASSTVPDGLNSYCFAKKQTSTQFKTEFWSIFYSLGFRLPSEQDQNKTFIFEIMSKNHIIVVKRDKSDLCLHGVRDIKTLQQQDHIPYGEKYKWRVSLPLQIPKQEMNMDCFIKRVEQLNPLQCEGYVLCDKNWTRIKIKSSSYVRINWLGELNLGFNKDPKKYILMEIILSGEADIFCQYCPEWKELIQQYLNKIKSLNTKMISIYEPLKEYGQRQYAEAIKNQNRNIQAFLFAIKMNPKLYYGKVEFVMSPKKFYEFIDTYKQ